MSVCVCTHALLFIYTFIHPSGVNPIAIILIAATQDLGFCPASPNSVAPTLQQLPIIADYPQKEVNVLEKIRTVAEKPG